MRFIMTQNKTTRITKNRVPKKVWVEGLLRLGAWHTDGKIPLGARMLISGADAKLLLSRGHVKKVSKGVKKCRIL